MKLHETVAGVITTKPTIKYVGENNVRLISIPLAIRTEKKNKFIECRLWGDRFNEEKIMQLEIGETVIAIGEVESKRINGKDFFHINAVSITNSL